MEKTPTPIIITKAPLRGINPIPPLPPEVNQALRDKPIACAIEKLLQSPKYSEFRENPIVQQFIQSLKGEKLDSHDTQDQRDSVPTPEGIEQILILTSHLLAYSKEPKRFTDILRKIRSEIIRAYLKSPKAQFTPNLEIPNTERASSTLIRAVYQQQKTILRSRETIEELLDILGVLTVDTVDIERLIRILPTSTYSHPTVMYFAHRLEKERPQSEFIKQQRLLRERFNQRYHEAKQHGRAIEFWKSEAEQLAREIILPVGPFTNLHLNGPTTTTLHLTTRDKTREFKVDSPNTPFEVLRLIRAHGIAPDEIFFTLPNGHPVPVLYDPTTGRVIPQPPQDARTIIARTLVLTQGGTPEKSLPIAGYLAKLPLTPDLALHLFENLESPESTGINQRVVFPPQFVQDFIQCTWCIQILTNNVYSNATKILTQNPEIAAYVVLELLGGNSDKQIVPDYLNERLRQPDHLKAFLGLLSSLKFEQLKSIMNNLMQDPQILEILYAFVQKPNYPERLTAAILILSKFQTTEKTMTTDAEKPKANQTDEATSAPLDAIAQTLLIYANHIDCENCQSGCHITDNLKFINNILRHPTVRKAIKERISTDPKQTKELLTRLILNTIRKSAILQANSTTEGTDFSQDIYPLLQETIRHIVTISDDVAKSILEIIVNAISNNPSIFAKNKLDHNFQRILEGNFLLLMARWFIGTYPEVAGQYLTNAEPSTIPTLLKIINSMQQAPNPTLIQALNSVISPQESSISDDPSVTELLGLTLNEIEMNPTSKLAVVIADAGELLKIIWENEQLKNKLISLLINEHLSTELTNKIVQHMPPELQNELLRSIIQKALDNPNTKAIYLLRHLPEEILHDIGDNLKQKIIDIIIQQSNSESTQPITTRWPFAKVIMHYARPDQINKIIEEVTGSPTSQLAYLLLYIPRIWARITEKQRIDLIFTAITNPESPLAEVVKSIAPRSVRNAQLANIRLDQ